MKIQIDYPRYHNKMHRKIANWMTENLNYHIDPITGEINRTGLAEEACQALDGYVQEGVPEYYFEISHEISACYEDNMNAENIIGGNWEVRW